MEENKIDPFQIPAKGRNLKCGSCNHIWFYKIEDKKIASTFCFSLIFISFKL